MRKIVSVTLYLWETKLRETQSRLGSKAKKTDIVTEEDALKAIS